MGPLNDIFVTCSSVPEFLTFGKEEKNEKKKKCTT